MRRIPNLLLKPASVNETGASGANAVPDACQKTGYTAGSFRRLALPQPRNPRSATGKLPTYGKIVPMSQASTPSHFASVAEY